MNKVLRKFSIYELVLIAVMAALGIAVKPVVVPVAHLIAGPLMIPSGALAGGFYMLWLVVGFGLTGKYGTGTLISFVQALMVIFMGAAGSHGIMSLFSYTAPGIFMDLILFLIGHRVCCRPCAFIAGAAANFSGTFAVNLIFFRLPPVFLLMTMGIALLSGGMGGLLSWELLKILKKFGLAQKPDACCPGVSEEEASDLAVLPMDTFSRGEIPAIYVRNLSVCYQKGEWALRHVSFSAPKGTITVVLGLSGCGKSTLCHCISGIIPYRKGEIAEGSIYLFGKKAGAQTLSGNARLVGTVLQNPDEQLVASAVEDELAFGPENQCIEPDEIRQRVDGILRLLHIEDLRYRNPVRLSGGQKHLVSIGSLLTMEPDILILDEPLSHLDEAGQKQVLSCLKKLRNLGKTILVAEHNYLCLEFADIWIVMQDGEILISGTPSDVLSRRDMLREAHLNFGEGTKE